MKNEIFSSDFKVISWAPSAEAAGYQRGVYYQGIVRNTQGRSIAAISIVGDEVIGVIDVEGEGNFILGELEGDERGRYAFFRADDLKHEMKTSCDTETIPQTVLETAEQIGLNAEDPNKCVRGDMAIDNVVVTGGAALSETITTAGSAGLEWKGVYPNPSTGRVNLEISSAQATIIHLSVVDVLGRLTDLGKHALTPGRNVIGVNLPAGQNGVFLLKMFEGGRVQSKPVMIMR